MCDKTDCEAETLEHITSFSNKRDKIFCECLRTIHPSEKSIWQIFLLFSLVTQNTLFTNVTSRTCSVVTSLYYLKDNIQHLDSSNWKLSLTKEIFEYRSLVREF